MEITDEVLIKVKKKFIAEELPEKLEDWKLSVPNGNDLCFIQQALADFTGILHRICHNDYIEEYNLQEIKKEQKLKQEIKDLKLGHEITIKTLNDQYEKDLDKIKSEVLVTLDSEFRKNNLLNDIQNITEGIK